MKSFSKMVHEGRSKKRYSVRQLADVIRAERGVSVTGAMIHAIEKGKYPSYQLAYSISWALGLDLQEAMTAAFRDRAEHCVLRERKNLTEFLRSLPAKEKIKAETVTQLPRWDRERG